LAVGTEPKVTPFVASMFSWYDVTLVDEVTPVLSPCLVARLARTSEPAANTGADNEDIDGR